MLLAWLPATSRVRTPRRWPVTPPAGILDLMSDVTRILSTIEQGDPRAAEQPLPLDYDEMRRLATEKMADERPGRAPLAPPVFGPRRDGCRNQGQRGWRSPPAR